MLLIKSLNNEKNKLCKNGSNSSYEIQQDSLTLQSNQNTIAHFIKQNNFFQQHF